MPSTFCTGRVLAAVRMARNSSFSRRFNSSHIFDLLAVGFLAQLLKDFVGGGGAEVGADERGFQIVERVAVDFLAERNDFFDAFGEVFPRARDRLFHAVEEAGFLLLVEAAK